MARQLLKPLAAHPSPRAMALMKPRMTRRALRTDRGGLAMGPLFAALGWGPVHAAQQASSPLGDWSWTHDQTGRW